MVTGRRTALGELKNEKEKHLKHNEYSNIKKTDDFNIRTSDFQDTALIYLKELNKNINDSLINGDHKRAETNKKLFQDTESCIYALKLTYRILESEFPSEMINYKNRNKILFSLRKFHGKPDFFALTEKEKEIVDSLLFLYKEEKEPMELPEVLF
jgi:hypothetical protein